MEIFTCSLPHTTQALIVSGHEHSTQVSSSADDGRTNKQTNKQKGANKQRDDVVFTLHATVGLTEERDHLLRQVQVLVLVLVLVLKGGRLHMEQAKASGTLPRTRMYIQDGDVVRSSDALESTTTDSTADMPTYLPTTTTTNPLFSQLPLQSKRRK